MPSPRFIPKLLFFITTVFITCGLGVAQEYDRALFPHWEDFDKDGANTREEVLIRDSLTVLYVDYFKESNDLVVYSGTWSCPYTGIIFTDPRYLDADHIVPLKYAWDHGASEWSEQTRRVFANDMDNVLVVCRSANRMKGARGPLEWIPSRIGYVATYVAKFISICKKYNLAYNEKELDELVKFFNPYSNGILLERTNFNKDGD